MTTPSTSKAACAVLLLALGCGPQEGDVYEHKLTRERIEIERVGQGGRLYQFYTAMNELMEEFEEDEAMRIVKRVYPMLSSADSLKPCVAYRDETVLYAPEGQAWIVNGKEITAMPMAYMRIISLVELEEEYIKVQ